MHKPWKLADIMLATLANKMKKYFFLLIFFILIFINHSNAGTNFYKCPEKITNVRLGNELFFKKGKEIGNNIIKLDTTYAEPIITINFEFNETYEKPFEVMKNKRTKLTSLGFEVNNKIDTDEYINETFYSFIKLEKSYAFTRKDFWWSPNESEYDKDNKHDYNSTGRCFEIDKKQYAKLLKKTPISEDQIKKKDEVFITKKSEKLNLEGTRTFALSWEGYDDLILGSITFSEKDLIGKIDFNLPNNEGNCFGTYALSKQKGTWSLRCDHKDMNASGFLKWNSDDGSVSGNGKDSLGKKVKFKVAPS